MGCCPSYDNKRGTTTYNMRHKRKPYCYTTPPSLEKNKNKHHPRFPSLVISLNLWNICELSLYWKFQGLGTKDRALIRVTVSRCEVDMKQIKMEFQRKYGKGLESFIRVSWILFMFKEELYKSFTAVYQEKNTCQILNKNRCFPLKSVSWEEKS